MQKLGIVCNLEYSERIANGAASSREWRLSVVRLKIVSGAKGMSESF